MGTVVERRRQGLATELLMHIQNLAKSDGRPIWIEATTEVSLDLYLKMGFKLAGEVVLGKGSVSAGGDVLQGGLVLSFGVCIGKRSKGEPISRR